MITDALAWFAERCTINMKGTAVPESPEPDVEQHVLLRKATRRPYAVRPEMPEDAVYDDVRGHWITPEGPLARRVGGPTTKKCDQETGEDQKGE
jgi:hypothetical protein